MPSRKGVLTMKTAAMSNELINQPPVKPFPLIFLRWNQRKLARPKANHVEKSEDTADKKRQSEEP